ncbi:MAG: DUF3303 domain-containing protein [Paracoccaceae bacterium]
MQRYMVIERFRQGNSAAVYDRFHAQGRLLPEGLHYIDSWLSADDTTCYQVMETNHPETFDIWIAHWNDLVEFEVIELKDKPTGSTT